MANPITEPVRLWHQSMTELAGLGTYRSRLQAHAAELFGSSVALDVHGLAPGSYGGVAPTEVLGYPYIHHLVSRQALAAARTAERHGYDAFVVGSFSEPLLRELRSAVDIPVVSLNESTLLIACSLGRRTAFVANAPSVAALVSASVDRHELTARVAGVYSIEPGLTEPELMSADPAAVLEAFTSLGRRLAAGGADVLVPAEGVMCEVLHETQLYEIDGVPVLDSVGVTWRHAVLLIALWRSGMRASRRRTYPRADADAVRRIEDATGIVSAEGEQASTRQES